MGEQPQLPPDRMAPHSVEAEEAVLGAVLLNPEVLYDLTYLQANDFFIVRNGWVWETFLKLGEQIDYMTVAERLRADSRLDEIGGAAYITYLINHTPASIYADAYARIVQRAAIRRRLLNAASEIATEAHAEEKDINGVIDAAYVALDKATTAYASRNLIGLDDGASRYFDVMFGEAGRMVPTGFTDLDELIGGVAAGDLGIVAGRPGMGKTSWLLTLALNVARWLKATNQPGCVLFCSLEMDANQLVERLVSMLTGIPVSALRARKLTDLQVSEFTTALLDDLADLPIVIDDSANFTISQLKADYRQAAREYGGVALVIVDYVQLMTVEQALFTSLKGNEIQIHSYLSRNLKQIARTLNVPVISAAQLNREVEKGADKRPKLSHLRSSGSYEQDADHVWFLYRDEVYNENTESPNQAEVIVAKNRHGSTGTVRLYFRKERTLFENMRLVEIDLAAFTENVWKSYQDIQTTIKDDKPEGENGWQT